MEIARNKKTVTRLRFLETNNVPFESTEDRFIVKVGNKKVSLRAEYPPTESKGYFTWCNSVFNIQYRPDGKWYPINKRDMLKVLNP